MTSTLIQPRPTHDRQSLNSRGAHNEEHVRFGLNPSQNGPKSASANKSKQAYEGKGNPFAFKAYDKKMMNENAAQYIPPSKRKYIREYLSNSSVNLQTVSTKQEIAQTFQSSNQVMMKHAHVGQTPEQIKLDRVATINR
jgi:hypothetical protein